MKLKVLFVIAIVVATIVCLIWFVRDRNSLRQEYHSALLDQEKEFIDDFFKSEVNGVITYIKKYEDQPDTYVIAVKDSLKQETTIGKVKIINFMNVNEGDSLKKEKNTFEILVKGKHIKALIKN